MTRKSTPFKAASAVIAGLLVLGSGIAVAGADSDDPTPEPVEVVSDPTGASLVAESDTDMEDGAAGETAPDGSEDGDVKPDPVEDGDDAVDDKPVVGGDPADGDDGDAIEITDDNDGIVTISGDADPDAEQGEVKEHPVHPENHGAQVSQAARQKEVVAGSDARNHGATVSAIAKSKSHADGDDDDKVKGDDEDATKKAKDGDDDDVDDDDVDDDDVDDDDDDSDDDDSDDDDSDDEDDDD